MGHSEITALCRLWLCAAVALHETNDTTGYSQIGDQSVSGPGLIRSSQTSTGSESVPRSVHSLATTVCDVLLPGISGISMWSQPRLSATHVQCRYVGVVPWLLCSGPRAGLATAAVADGNIADVIPWWGPEENSGAEWRGRESRSTTWGRWTFPSRARRRTNSVAQQFSRHEVYSCSTSCMAVCGTPSLAGLEG